MKSNEQSITLTNLKLNQSVPEREFELPIFPDGTECIDLTNKTVYPINGQWKPIGPSHPHEVYRQTTEAPPGGQVGVPGKTSETEAPDYSGWWLVGLAASLLLAAAGMVAYRRRGRRE